MWSYIIRRILLTIPTVLGIVALTFALFNLLPGDPARALAGKNPSPATLAALRAKMGLDKPRWFNLGAKILEVSKFEDGSVTVRTDTHHGLTEGDLVRLSNVLPEQYDGVYKVIHVGSSTMFSCAPQEGMHGPPTTQALEVIQMKPPSGRIHRVGFFNRMGELFNSQFCDLIVFRLPKSLQYDQSVWELIEEKGPVSLTIQLPAFLITIGLQLVLALYVAARRGKAIDYTVTTLTVIVMSLPSISLYLMLQWLVAWHFSIFPIAGWQTGFYSLQYAALPILAMVFVSVGGGARFYRTMALEEISSDYVRTARSKGVGGREVLLTHVLRNIMIPLVTNTVTALPFLILGALILENIFQIPGLGGLLVQAIFNKDFTLVMSLVYLTSIAYCLSLLANDILYTLVDPRVSLQ